MLPLILLTFVISSASSYLYDPANYAELVTKKMVENFERNEQALELLKFLDFTQQIDATRYGKRVAGPMRFHSGYLIYIGSGAITRNESFISDQNVTVRIFFELRDFQTTYDIRYDLEDYKADGAVMIEFVAASYEIEIIRPHDSTATESTIKYIGTKGKRYIGPKGNQKVMEVVVDPENEYTQIVAHEIKSKKMFRNPMDNSFREWVTVFKPALDEAIAETPFPKINYYED